MGILNLKISISIIVATYTAYLIFIALSSWELNEKT